MEKWLTDKGPGTHVLMDGGILQVPYEQLDEFYSECVHSIRLGKKLYVVEQKTDVLKHYNSSSMILRHIGRKRNGGFQKDEEIIKKKI